ncbi:hypothetical protein FAY30_17835 [Bacillus sp. S3]|uniref:PilN domain-containing protein n=1 Tax=Bacillus sp. S3 TaxID=486398 RepID=UPI00118A4DD4|nr:PilN domain-containing protein [Bacillus sp. S3]QCJ43625.1 hypothetical protein FAY30_17835 [Bacillus sp. S3]
MLVEINLLPHKESKKLGFIISLSSIVALLLIAGAYYYWQINVTKNEVASLDRQIAMTKKVTQREEQNSQTVEAANSVSQLKSAIHWADDYPIQTIPVMRHLTSLLPERGFIQSFGYKEEGTITLSVQFDSAREAAYFLDNLNKSKWIAEASLSSLAAAADPAEDATTGNVNQTNTTATDSQANTTDSTVNTTNQTSTPNQTQTGQNTTGVTANTGGQTNSASGTTNTQNNTVNTTTNTNTVINTGKTTAGTNVTKNSNILPRYTGQFEIKLDKEFVKKNIKKSTKDEKGVAGS